MSFSIWKYTLVAEITQTIEIPKGSKLLSAEEQYDEIVIYALVNLDEQEKEDVSISVFGTGHVVPANIGNDYTFLQTVKMQGGALMFHVFYCCEGRH